MAATLSLMAWRRGGVAGVVVLRFQLSEAKWQSTI